MKRREMQVWTVRNADGQYLGNYRTYTSDQAIQRLKDEQLALASTFRKSHGVLRGMDGLTAKVEKTAPCVSAS